MGLVTPAKAGVQLEASQRMKLDSGLRRNDDEGWGVQIHQMHRAFRSGFSPSGMKEGWSVPSRGANFSLIGERGRSTPAIFRRSLSPHSLRDVSKPRGHSTQPLLLQHVQDCIQAPALSPHSKGDIRTAPPSRSRVTDYKHNNRNAVKRNITEDGDSSFR